MMTVNYVVTKGGGVPEGWLDSVAAVDTVVCAVTDASESSGCGCFFLLSNPVLCTIIIF